MCGAGLHVRCSGAVLVSRSGRVGRGRALGLCSPGAASVRAELSGGGSLRDVFDLEIGSDGFFDHTRWAFAKRPSRTSRLTLNATRGWVGCCAAITAKRLAAAVLAAGQRLGRLGCAHRALRLCTLGSAAGRGVSSGGC